MRLFLLVTGSVLLWANPTLLRADPGLIFDIDDYLDPIERGYDYVDPDSNPGLDYGLFRASGGYLWNVEFGDQLSELHRY